MGGGRLPGIGKYRGDYVDLRTLRTTPDRPPAGFDRLFVKPDKTLAVQKDDGTIVDLGSGGGIAETLIDAKGDLIVGSAADTAARLAVGSNDQIPMADSGQSTGIKWVGSQTPTTQAYDDAAAEGTADTYARGDHLHGMPSAGTGGGDFPIGLALGDTIPASPGAEDEEFEGTADTLPTDWSWVSTAPTFTINSAFPSLMVIERGATDATEYKLRKANFNMVATSGLWVKMGIDFKNGDSGQWEWIAYDSSSVEGYGAGVHNGNIPLGRWSNSGTLANRGSGQNQGSRPQWYYLGIVRVSNTFAVWVSSDGVNWSLIQAAESKTFTVDRLEFRWSGASYGYVSSARVDWIRYRTDNLFPRP